MGSTKRISIEQLMQLKNLAKDSIKSITDDPEQDEFVQYEMQDEIDARQKVFDALNSDEKNRWDHIKQLLEKRDNDRITKFIGIQLQESERVNAYFKASLMSISEFEEYLIKMIRELDHKISKYSFGRELLENFSNEKFLLLFVDGDRYRPLNLAITEYYEEKGEREIKDKLIKLFAKEKALLHILMNLPECPSDQSEQTKEKKGKPGRKKIEVADDFSIKDIASPDQIKALNTLLIKHGYIEEIDGRFYRKKSKSVKKFAAIIKSLHEYGYSAKFKAAQAYYILTNDYNVTTTENTVNQAEDDNALSILKANPYLKKQ
jgi:hypothetical protein